MKFSDVLGLALGNLKRRKWRTVLTVLGVFIGTISVVIMLSLGFGLKSSMEKQLNAYGTMTELELNYMGSDKDLYITDEKVEEFKELDYVESVSPQLMAYAILEQGRWCIDTYVIGLTDEELAKIDIGEGTLPDGNSKNLSIVVGNQMLYEAYDKNTYEYVYWSHGEIPDIDFMNKPMTVRMYSDSDVGIDSEGNIYDNSRKKTVNVSGMVAGDIKDSNKYSYFVYTDIDSLKKYLESNYRGKTIPDQPTDKNGAPLNYWVYRMATIRVDSADNVDLAVEYFRSLGYSVNSNREWMEQTNGILVIVQLVLGGIGAVALLVAAIGITNTITMSIYERRKEIGIMKVLGCDLKNIGGMFLSEAAFIGFLGGAFGVIVSYGISALLNIIASPMLSEMIEMNLEISRIPFWLAPVAIIFAIMVGMLAGYVPSRNATRLSPLVAIRNE
ncbi:MAG: ABC transporter permease [Lachnospiraceae bacterium]|nr:ABC transporter permease [Lachnospiraceae bacterium]